MSFIMLSEMKSRVLTLEKACTEERLVEFKSKYQSNGDERNIRDLMRDFSDYWSPKNGTMSLLINIDCIESCEEIIAEAEEISVKHHEMLPRLTKVILKNGKEYVVRQDVTRIENRICNCK